MHDYDAGRALDALIIERVLGWQPPAHPEATARGIFWTRYDGWCLDPGPDRAWSPSTEIADAWQLVELLRRRYHFALISRGRTDGLSDRAPGWQAELSPYGPDMRLYRGLADTPALAICRAALAAMAAA